MDGVGEGGEFIAHISPVAAAGFADIDDRIEFLASVFEGLADFGELDCRGVAAVGKADCGAGVDFCSGEKLCAAGEGVGQNADAGYVIANGESAAFFELRRGERGVEQRVIDHLGDGGVVEGLGHVSTPGVERVALSAEFRS